MYKNSPVAQIHEGAASVRRRLHGAGAVLDFPILEEIAALGATDYFAAALVHGDGDRSYFSWATDADGGFSDEAILRLSRLVPFVGVRIELDSARYTLRSLLEVYLGHNAAARVLSGRFRRGQGETLRCAILFSDMRGFTSLADHASPHDVVATLDAYFEKVAGPISTHGGEVLKFVGDAVLAIFPCHDGDASACARAVEAARDALGGLDALNATRTAPPLALGIALHLGEVMYGNIGARDRLDFTVIGAAVNEASRVEGMCKTLGVPVLLTRAFQGAYPGAATSVGHHALKGVSEPHELFTLPLDVTRAT
jgi:adenylate cyclase